MFLGMCYNVKDGGMVMYYYKIKDGYVIQYFVSLDLDRLKNLRTDIIENCSTIKHMHYKTAKRPNQYDAEHIRNYRERFIRVIQYNDLCSNDEDEYEVEYDLLVHHEMVSYIDSLIGGNTSFISKIEDKQDNNDDEEKILWEENKKLIQNIIHGTQDEIQFNVNLLNQNIEKLSQYSREKELNKYQSPIVIYQKQVLECIHLKEVSKISLNTVLEIQDFLDQYHECTAEDELNKVLTLEKRKTI